MAQPSERDRGLADHVIGRTGVDDLGDSGDPIDEDALETRLESDRRRRARHTGPDEFDGDESGLLIDIVEQDVTIVGLDGRSDDLDDLLDLFAHLRSLRNLTAAPTPGPDRGSTRARLDGDAGLPGTGSSGRGSPVADHLGQRSVTRLEHRHRVAHDDAPAWLDARNDVVVERTVEHSATSAVFEAHVGPFEQWHRRVDLTLDASGHTIVDEVVEYRLAVPVWGVLFRPALRHHLRRAPMPDARQPWWAPPEALDARASTVLSVLCVFAVVGGYLGTLITQTLTYAADEFDAGPDAQGTLLAIVRIGVIVSLGIVALADRRGRRRLLIAALVGSCIVTATGAASSGMVWLGVTQTFARSLSTVVVVLIAVMAAEEMPAGTRAFAVSVVTMTAALGAGMCVLNLVYIDAGAGAWRISYLVPLVAIAPCLLIARRLPETKRFEIRRHRMASSGTGSHRERIDWRRFVMLATGAFLWSLFLAPAAQFLNEFLRTERGFSGVAIAVFVLATNTPGGIGIVVGGKLADRHGRRIIGAIGIAGGVIFTVVSYLSWGWPLWLASILAAVIGAMAVPALAVYGPELFPTRQRGTANGSLQVVAVAGSSVGLLVVGWLADRVGGIGQAMAIVAIAPALLVAVVLLWFPETARRELEELNPADRHPDERLPD